MEVHYDNIPEINKFIIKAFNFYNGKINTFNNKAILQINWAYQFTSTNAGITRNPNVVIIFPRVVARYTPSPFHFYYTLIETIIHELYHIDQVINYYYMAFVPEYQRAIENAVELQTSIYAANHIIEIAEEFGLDLTGNDAVFKKMMTPFYGAQYHRRRYDTHMISILSEIIGALPFADEAYTTVTRNINEKINGVSIVINGEEIIVQHKDYLMPIYDLNSFMYEHYFQYEQRTGLINGYVRDDGIYEISMVDIDGKNVMARIV